MGQYYRDKRCLGLHLDRYVVCISMDDDLDEGQILKIVKAHLAIKQLGATR